MSLTGQATPSTSNIQLIINALADYAELTGIDLPSSSFAAVLEQSNSPDAILELLQAREKAFKEYRDGNRRLICCLSPAVRVLQAFSGILGEATSLVPFPPTNALFVGIDALLAAASGVTSSYDALLDLFECLGNFLKRLEIYTTIAPTPIMIDIIIKIMVELLSVLALATKQIKQGRFKKFAKKLLGESEIEAVVQRLDRLTQDEARMTVAQTLSVVHGLVGNVKVVMEDGKVSTDSIRQDLVALHQVSIEMNRMKRDQLRQDVQLWLSPPDPSTNHNFVRKSRHRGTASWFFESDAITEWKTRGSLLWIHGKPGAGKSTLLSAIIQDVEARHATGLATMAYYYFDFRDVKKQDSYGLLSSLVSQLSADSDSCFNILCQLYSNHSRGIRKPDIDALKQCLTDMLGLSGQAPIYIIVDALDECPNSSGMTSAREEILELIEELVDLKLPNVHLCVASRPEIDIRTVLEPLTSLQISLHDEGGQKDDIIAYIKSVVRSDRYMRKWREEDQNLVIDTLSQNADGMFRWVVCQLERLRRCFPASIRSALADLPESLDKTYEQILSGIDKEKRKYAQSLFQCLLVSIRPLRVEELAEVLAVQFDPKAPPLFKEDLRPPDAEEAVLSACSSLIAVINREGSREVQFSHFSVKEFLTSKRLETAEERLSYYHILPEPAHIILAHAGLSVLLQLDEKIDRTTIGHFPLAMYAARYWVDHAQFGDVSSHIQEVMERLFDPTKPHFSAWVWLYDIDRHWIKPMSKIHPTQPEAAPIYYASMCGFCGLVEHLIAAHSQDINSRGGTYTTSLHVASVKGNFDVASLLLQNGADLNSRDHMGRAPLHRVSQGGQLVMAQLSVEIARLLVNSGADMSIADDEGQTPLHAAARSGHRDIAELLLELCTSLDVRNRRSDMNSRDKYGRTPLHTASRYGHLDLVKLLLERGARVHDGSDEETTFGPAASKRHSDLERFLFKNCAAASAYDNLGQIPFHTASYFGHLHIVKFFLECGIDIDIRGEREQTPLFVASLGGTLDVVHFLIEHGADIHAKDKVGANSLHAASHAGKLDVVRMLINTGIAVDIQNRFRQTPLLLACVRGKVEVARFLIERGANINVRDNQSRTPLYFASERGHLDAARLLLDHGADANIRLPDLRSPLHVVSANGHLKIAELLVQHGASVDVFNKKQETPLYQAVMNGKVSIARVLIDHGAKLHSTYSNGCTLLHVASEYGHLGVVKLLLRRGADVDVINKAKKTAAELASENGQTEVAKFLALYKTDANIRNNICSTASDTDQHGVEEDGNDEGNSSLHGAAEEGNIDTVRLLLEQGVDIDGRNARYETPLNRAAEKGHVDVVRLLVERGAEVDSCDERGWTSLIFTSQFGHLEVSQVLIDHGANVNARHLNHWTPIHASATRGYPAIVKLLLERGADVHAVNGDGDTPYQKSLQQGHREISDLLREYGACRESPQATA